MPTTLPLREIYLSRPYKIPTEQWRQLTGHSPDGDASNVTFEFLRLEPGYKHGWVRQVVGIPGVVPEQLRVSLIICERAVLVAEPDFDPCESTEYRHARQVFHWEHDGSMGRVIHEFWSADRVHWRIYWPTRQLTERTPVAVPIGRSERVLVWGQQEGQPAFAEVAKPL